MAKVGYIFKANHYDTYEADKEWMLNFGCEQIIEEETDHEVMRPQWKQLMNALYRGDVLVVSKFSNAVRGVRELSVCIEMCRIKVVRLISIQDRIDSHNELFKETTAADVLEWWEPFLKKSPHCASHPAMSCCSRKISSRRPRRGKTYPGLNGKGASWTCITAAIL